MTYFSSSQRIASFALLLPAVLAWAAPVPEHIRTSASDYFPTTAGTKWVYQEGDDVDTLTIITSESKSNSRILSTKRKGEPTHLTLALSGKIQVSDTSICLLSEKSQSCLLQFPQDHDVTWKQGEFTNRVFLPERVEVPAGVFMAIRVSSEGSGMDLLRGEQTKVEESYWYAKKVGIVKYIRIEYSTKRRLPKSEIVLKSYTPGIKEVPEVAPLPRPAVARKM